MGEVPTRSHSSDPVFHDEMQAPGEMREIRNNMAPMRLTYDKEESAPNLAWTDAQPGEYCLVQREAEDSSPAIICDEELVQAHEAESGGQRPKNAKKPDGDWPAKYRERGSHAGERMFLVLFLDKLTFHWVRWDMFTPTDIQTAAGTRADTNIPKSAQVDHDIALERELEFWKSEVVAKQMEEAGRKSKKRSKVNSECNTGDGTESDYEECVKKRRKQQETLRVTKRRYQDEFRLPLGIEYDAVDDDESHLFLPEPPIKQESDLLGAEVLHGDGATSAYGFRTDSETKHISQETSGLQTSNTSFRNDVGPSATARSMTDDEGISIHVGYPVHRYPVKKNGLQESAILSALMLYHPDEGYYITDPTLTSIDSIQFAPVVEYLNTTEYYPLLLDYGTEYARLQGVESLEDRNFAISQCATVYALSAQFELPLLRQLAFRKFKVLASYPPEELLETIVRMFAATDPPEDEVCNYFTDYVMENFYELMESAPTSFAAIMHSVPRISGRVYAQMAAVHSGAHQLRMQGGGEGGHETGGPDIKEEGDESSGHWKGFLPRQPASSSAADTVQHVPAIPKELPTVKSEPNETIQISGQRIKVEKE